MPVEKPPVFGILSKYVDDLLSTHSTNLLVELALLTLISRISRNDKLPAIDYLSNALQVTQIEIEMGMVRLMQIGFLKESDLPPSN